MHPGRLDICDGTIRYRVNASAVWELPVSTVRVIGEVTNDHGPYLDDYFFCFVTDAERWYEASFYAEGREELLRSLADILGSELTLRLVGSTDYASNVLWPPDLATTAMFSFRPVQPKTWIGRLLGPTKSTQWFSDAVLEELRIEGRTRHCP